MSFAALFERLGARGEMALICYLTAGFPTMAESMRHVAAAVAAGADAIEIGIPFSDPIADGPTIQHASHVALQSGATLRKTIAALREHPFGVPLAIMSYLNPLLAYGRDQLLGDARQAGVNGLIIPDLPADESDEWLAEARAREIVLIPLAAPTSMDDRLREIGRRCDTFVYAVSVAGTTGARRALPAELSDFLSRVRFIAGKPIAVGFGISSPEHVRDLRGRADGVIVGSRLIEAIRNQEDLAAVVRDLKAATRS
jgi:tryptophan synthase alpha chain